MPKSQTDCDQYYNSKGYPQVMSFNSGDYHAITLPKVIIFLERKNNDSTVCRTENTEKFLLLLPFLSRICKLRTDVKHECWAFGESVGGAKPVGCDESHQLKTVIPACRDSAILIFER